MATVTIGSKEWTVYQDLEDSEEYIDAAIGPAADAWRSLSDVDPKTDRKRTSVSAARFLDAIEWSDDVDGVDYTVQATRIANIDFQNGSAELMMLIAKDPSLLTKASQGSNIQSLQAGSASISFFNPTSVEDGTATEFPTVIEKMLRKYMKGSGAESEGSGSSRGGMWNGGCESSHFDPCATFKRTEPF